MLKKIIIDENEIWDDRSEQFVLIPNHTVYLEHSLSSISKWEEKWHKAYSNQDDVKTNEELIDYARCMCVKIVINNIDIWDNDIKEFNEIPDYISKMCITEKPEELYFSILWNSYKNEIEMYMNDKMTATVINNTKKNPYQTEIVTAEVIYYWIFSMQIPIECEHWHFNKLMTLINVFNIKNGKPDKMSKREIFERNRALNKARKAKMKGGH